LVHGFRLVRRLCRRPAQQGRRQRVLRRGIRGHRRGAGVRHRGGRAAAEPVQKRWYRLAVVSRLLTCTRKSHRPCSRLR